MGWPKLRQRPVPVEPVAPPAAVLTFVTVGGALVEVTDHVFTTTYTAEGRPFGGPPRRCHGYRWTCRGCTVQGEPGGWHDWNYLDCERRRARDDANEHAASCRAMAPV